MPSRVLVTGANGFIATRLIDLLVSRGNRTVRASTRSGGARVPSSIELVRGVDLLTQQRMKEAVADVDCIVHAAGRVHVPESVTHAEMELHDRINTGGTLALARAAAEAGTRRFIFISTIAVNGRRTEREQVFTEASPRSPDDPYAFSKAEAEKGLQALATETRMEIVIIRPPLVYGPGVQANFRTLMRWIARGVPLPFGAVVDNRRTLLGVDNFVDLILTCLDHPAAANQTFLAGDAEDLSTADLIRRLAAAMGVKARLVAVPPSVVAWTLERIGRRELSRRLCGSLRLDISKARDRLGWTPSVSVDEGFRRAAAEYWIRRGKSP